MKTSKMQRYNRIQFIFTQVLFVCALSFLFVIAKYFKPHPNLGVLLLFTLLIVFSIITMIAIVKRLHDMGMSGFWVIAVLLLTIMGKFFPDIVMECVDTGIVIFFALMPGNKTANQYGLPSEERWKLL